MTRFVPRPGTLAALALTLAPAVAAAQVGPGVPGGPTGTGEEEDKPDGVAEAAPKTPGLLPTTPTLPPPKGARNKFELIEVDGYFRLRADYLKNLNLSFRDDPSQGGSPFPRPLGCTPAEEMTPGDVSGRPCGDTFRSTNVRLRLEPRINVSETTSVHTQIDILDNYVLGTAATAAGVAPPRPATEIENEIRVNRAWAEVATPLGILKFGRMPWHWGLGIAYNSGAEDPINGGYDLDADYGDSVDRVMFGTLIPGTRLRAGLAMDFPFTGPTTTWNPGALGGGQAWDLDNDDDISRWVLMISRMDSPQEFRDAIDRGELVLNYGVQFSYVQQKWSYNDADDVVDASSYVPRDATVYVPDVWLKLGWGPALFELEAIAEIGNVNELSDLEVDDPVDIRALGGVGRFTYRAMEDKLKFGLEVGAASGDAHDNVIQGQTHLSGAQYFMPGDRRMSRFVFDPDYKVDLILFRELIGAVSNAAYGRPFMSYDLTDSIQLKVANITSFALKPVSTPGNARMWGTEFNADLGYSSSTFFAGIAYGVLFPLAAMNHPDDPEFPYGEESTTFPDLDPTITNVGDAGNAHTIQLRAVVKF